jgi:hypothetical protein
MKLHRSLLALPLAVFLAGCSPVDSFNPLYTDKDVVFDPALLGQWGPASDGMNFAKLGDDAYRVVMSGKDDNTGQIVSAVFDAHLVQLQNHLFLDVVWRQSPSGNDDQTVLDEGAGGSQGGLEIESHLVKAGMGAYLELLPGEPSGGEDRFRLQWREAHQFFKVVMEDDGQTLKLVQFDDSWFKQQIREGKLVIDHEAVRGNSPVLTAGTPELQRLVLDHVNDEEAFQGETVVHRLLPQ